MDAALSVVRNKREKLSIAGSGKFATVHVLHFLVQRFISCSLHSHWLFSRSLGIINSWPSLRKNHRCCGSPSVIMIPARRTLLHQMPNELCDEVFPHVDSTPLVHLGPPHPPSIPPRTTITLADVVNSNCEARVRTKNRKRAIQCTPPAAPPSSSSKPCAHPSTSPVSIRPRRGPSVEIGSLSSRFGAGNPMVGITPSPTPPTQGQASSANLGPSPPSPLHGTAPSRNPGISPSHHHPGTTVPSSSFLVHSTEFTATSSCHFLDSNLRGYKELWQFSLIGFIAGKFPGYTSISKYVHSTWKCNVNFSMHDSGWLIFKFTSELDMLAVLNGGPYHVFGRLLILKHMPDYFDFDTSDMIRLPVWVKFPNLSLQCWSPLCLSKLASVIGKPVHADTPTASMTRLSYARVLVEVDLLADLPSLINITLPNGVSKSQVVLYESLPRFCKQCKTLGHSNYACTKSSSHKRKKPPQQLLLPPNAPLPQLIQRLLKSSPSGRNLKENRRLIQWLLRQL